jgi:ribosome-associated translation inhibitor RaiA
MTFFRIQIDINYLNKILNDPKDGQKLQKSIEMASKWSRMARRVVKKYKNR